MCVSLTVVGAYFHLQRSGSSSGLEFMPLAGLVLFMVGYSIGFASIPFVLMGELFPSRKVEILPVLFCSHPETYTVFKN